MLLFTVLDGSLFGYILNMELDDQSTANRLFNNSVNPAFYLLVVINATFLKSNVPMKVSRGS